MNKTSTTTSGRIRPTAVAGKFYPRDPVELRKVVETLVATAQAPAGPAPKAVIAPHAGYPYSGPIAASAYAHWVPARGAIKRIVLLAPSHFVAFDGLATSSVDAFATPLGLVPVDVQAVRKLAALPQVAVRDEAHAYEHALEVQLPFLQVVLGEFTLVPLVAGDIGADQVSQVLDALWDDPATGFVISSDLSHYHDSRTARGLDGATVAAIEALNPEGVGEDRACGRIPICGLLQVCRRHGLRARTVDLRNSGDTVGPPDRVVGYGAFVFEERRV